MKKTYHTIRTQGKFNEQQLASFLVKNGQGLLPTVDLIEPDQLARDELSDVTGRATIQAVLLLSAFEAAGGPPQQGKRRRSEVVFYGHQRGQVFLSDRKLEVARPRLRKKGPVSQEVEIPAYAAMQSRGAMGTRMLEILMRGVSKCNYKEVIPAMAETVEVSRFAVSRRVAEASEAEVQALLSRRFDDLKLLVIYVDGLVFGDYTMIGAVGVDSEGNKHVLGIREGRGPQRQVFVAGVEGSHGELHGDHGTARRTRVARRRSEAQDAVRHRRLKGAQNRHQRGLWQPATGATLPRPQAAQCRGPQR